jgi:hypothetical protein
VVRGLLELTGRKNLPSTNGSFRWLVSGGLDHDIPHLSAELIGKYITDLHQLGLLN